MFKNLEDVNVVFDYLFYEVSILCSRIEFIMISYIIFEISRSGSDTLEFSSSTILEDIRISRPAQKSALEFAEKHKLLEITPLRSKGRSIKLGEKIKELLADDIQGD